MFCSKCGVVLNSTHVSTNSYEQDPPAPMALIIINWVLVVLDFLIPNFDLVFGIVFSLAILVCSIILLVNKNIASKINGGIILVIWIIQNLYTCIVMNNY